MRIVRQVLAGAAGIELAPIGPSRQSLIVQNIDDVDTVSLYNKPGKEHEGIMLYPHMLVQLMKEDDADKKWYCFSETGGAAKLNVIEIYAEEIVKPRPWWPW